MKKPKKITALFCALALLLSLCACGAQEQQAESESFVLRICQQADLTTLDPAMCGGTGEETVLLSLFENLLRLRSDGSGRAVPVPGMAKEYTSEKNFDDTVTYTFTLRSSARWSDGERVTSQDFVYAWRRLVDPATGSPNHTLLRMVAGYDTVRETGDATALQVSASGDKTFVVVLSAPCPYFISSICTAAATVPLRKKLVTGSESWASNANIVTNGPYRVGTWTAYEGLQTKRNSEYYEAKLVGPDALRFIFTESDDAAYELLRNGETDYIPALPDSVMDGLLQESDIQTVPLTQTSCVLYNHQTDSFSDPEVRKAFELALDRTMIAEKIGTSALPADGFVPYGISNTPENTDDFRTVGGALCAVQSEEYEQRCLLAQKALTQSGHYNGSGLTELRMLFLDEPMQQRMAALMTYMWDKVLNVKLTMQKVGSVGELDAALASGDYDIALVTISARSDDAMDFLERWRDGSEENVIGFFNEAYDLLIGVADTTRDLTARAAFLHDAEVLLLEDYALSPVCFFRSADLLAEGLQGVCRDCFGHACFTGVTRVENES